MEQSLTYMLPVCCESEGRQITFTVSSENYWRTNRGRVWRINIPVYRQGENDKKYNLEIECGLKTLQEQQTHTHTHTHTHTVMTSETRWLPILSYHYEILNVNDGSWVKVGCRQLVRCDNDPVKTVIEFKWHHCHVNCCHLGSGAPIIKVCAQMALQPLNTHACIYEAAILSP